VDRLVEILCDRLISCGIGMNVAGILQNICDSFEIPMGINFMDMYFTGSNADVTDSDLLAYWSNKDNVWRQLAKVTRSQVNVPTSSRSHESRVSIPGPPL